MNSEYQQYLNLLEKCETLLNDRIMKVSNEDVNEMITQIICEHGPMKFQLDYEFDNYCTIRVL